MACRGEFVARIQTAYLRARLSFEVVFLITGMPGDPEVHVQCDAKSRI